MGIFASPTDSPSVAAIEVGMENDGRQGTGAILVADVQQGAVQEAD